jgi:flagellar motor switch protein FliN
MADEKAQEETANTVSAASNENAQNETDLATPEAAAPVEVSRLETPELEVSAKPAATQADGEVNLNMIMDIPVDLHVELGATALSIREILKLGAGSIVELDRLAGSSADIIVNGKLIGQGDVVVVGDNFGVRIAKLVEPEKRIDSL